MFFGYVSPPLVYLYSAFLFLCFISFIFLRVFFYYYFLNNIDVPDGN